MASIRARDVVELDGILARLTDDLIVAIQEAPPDLDEQNRAFRAARIYLSAEPLMSAARKRVRELRYETERGMVYIPVPAFREASLRLLTLSDLPIRSSYSVIENIDVRPVAWSLVCDEASWDDAYFEELQKIAAAAEGRYSVMAAKVLWTVSPDQDDYTLALDIARQASRFADDADSAEFVLAAAIVGDPKVGDELRAIAQSDSSAWVRAVATEAVERWQASRADTHTHVCAEFGRRFPYREGRDAFKQHETGEQVTRAAVEE